MPIATRKDLLRQASKIRLAIFDVDGVLTDGSLFFTDSGEEMKAFHVRDGLGIRMLQSAEISIAIITGRTSKVVEHRMHNLGVTDLHQGCPNKKPIFEELLRQHELIPAEVLYVGDDIIDIPVMQQVGLPIAVADAHHLAKEAAAWITTAPGGRGAVREVAELVLQAQDRLEDALSKYLTFMEDA